MVAKKEFLELKEQVKLQGETIKFLQKHIEQLDQRIVELYSEKVLASHVNDLLSEQIDSLCQYSRRSCIVVEGLPVAENETIESVETSTKDILVQNLGFKMDTVVNEFDKAHRIGPVKDNKQKVIVKFRSHNFKSQVYANRRNCSNKKIKFRPSLTKKREDLLYEAIRNLEHHDNFHYAFADVNGTIKVKTNNKVNNKTYFIIRNETDIAKLLIELERDSIKDELTERKYASVDLLKSSDKDMVYDDAFCEIMLSDL